MAEFVGGEPIAVGVDEPITFENKIDTAFDVGCGIVFRKSGLYRVSIVGKHMSVTVEPERKKGKWNFVGDQMFECTECGTCYTQSQFQQMKVLITDPDFPRFCPMCGADMRKDEEK